MVRPPIDPDIGEVKREEEVSAPKKEKQKSPTKKGLFKRRK